MITEFLDRMGLSQKDKYIVLDWVLHELVLEAKELGIPRELRREDVLEIVNFDLDKWL